MISPLKLITNSLGFTFISLIYNEWKNNKKKKKVKYHHRILYFSSIINESFNSSANVPNL